MDYAPQQATATRLIAKFGGPAVLRRESGDISDAARFEISPFESAPDPVDYDVLIVNVGGNSLTRSDSLTRRPDSASLAWSKAGIMATPKGVKPEPSDKLVINGRAYALVQVEPLTPNPEGFTVLYEWTARE